MVARTRLAALEHIENAGRTKAVKNEGVSSDNRMLRAKNNVIYLHQ